MCFKNRDGIFLDYISQTKFMSFTSLGLSESLLKALEKKGYSEPSPIQQKAIPLVLKRHDLLASAQTGTGKTAGFTLPILQILSENPRQGRRNIRSLILTPTRELAAQIQENIKAYSEFLDIRSTVIFGGVNQAPQVATLKNGIDILIATPGRLLDLYQQRLLSIANVEILVLDEADRMLDMGFAKDIKRILAILPERRQNLLFSATFSLEIKKLASGILHDPELVEVTPEVITAEKVTHKIIRVDKSQKPNLVVKLIKDGDWQQVLIFTRTKHGANKLSERLDKSGISSAAIHGNKTQNARTKALSNFKSGDIKVLVATDIAARGLDIPLLPYVINFELPNVPEDYVHRIGRTGRAGAGGDAISLVSMDEMDYLKAIQKLLSQTLTSEIIKGYEPTEAEDTPQVKQEQRKPNPNFRKPHAQSATGRPHHNGENRTSSDNKNPKRFFGKRD